MKVLTSFIEILYYPLAFIVFVDFFSLKKTNKIRLIVYLIFIISLMFRGIYGYSHSSSSRYYSSLIILSIIIYSLSSVIQKSIITWMTSVLWVPFVIAIIFQICKCFSGYDDQYIRYVQETLSKEASQKTVFLDPKERFRLSRNLNCEYFDCINVKYLSNQGIINLWKDYSRWNSTILVCYKHKKEFPNIKEKINTNETALVKIGEYITNKKGSSLISLYRFNPLDISEPIKSQSADYIFNGDVERIEAPEKLSKEMKKWIDDGAIFYKNENLKFPVHDYILSAWSTMPSKLYPEVNADDTDAISGKYSLHIILHNETRIYLFNQIPSKAGALSFSIRFRTLNKPISVGRIDYGVNNEYNLSERLYQIISHDNKIHRKEFIINDYDVKGEKSIFFIQGSNIDFYLDDISYKIIEDN